MDVVSFERLGKVVGGNHAAVRNQALRLELRLTQACPVGLVAASVVVGRYLHEVKRNVAQRKFPAPVLHHRRQAVGVGGIAAHVGAALVPDDSLHGAAAHGTEHAVVGQHRAFIVGLYAADGGTVRGYVGIALQDVARQPALHPCASVGAVHNAHGNLQGVAQEGSEVEGSGAELHHVRKRPGSHPLPAARLLRGVALAHGHVEHPHAGRGGGGTDGCLYPALHAASSKALQGHLHVALSGGKPHFAHQHVLQRSLFAVIESYFVGGIPGFGCGKRQLPVSFPVGTASG